MSVTHVKSMSVAPPTCVDDGGPRLDVDAGCSLPGPEDPHQRLSGEDAGCFAHLPHQKGSDTHGFFHLVIKKNYFLLAGPLR